jgi:hypothetical protein
MDVPPRWWRCCRSTPDNRVSVVHSGCGRSANRQPCRVALLSCGPGRPSCRTSTGVSSRHGPDELRAASPVTTNPRCDHLSVHIAPSGDMCTSVRPGMKRVPVDVVQGDVRVVAHAIVAHYSDGLHGEREALTEGPAPGTMLQRPTTRQSLVPNRRPVSRRGAMATYADREPAAHGLRRRRLVISRASSASSTDTGPTAIRLQPV